MANYALVDQTELVDGVALWDGSSPWTPPAGLTAIQSDTAQVGWTYNPQTKTFTAPVPPPPTPDQQYALNITNGIAITSTGTPALNGTYGLDQNSQTQLAGIAATVGLLEVFPGGTSTFVYPDLSGNPKTFPSVATFKGFYAAYGTLLLQMSQTLAILDQGGQAQWPSQSATIP